MQAIAVRSVFIRRMASASSSMSIFASSNCTPGNHRIISFTLKRSFNSGAASTDSNIDSHSSDSMRSKSSSDEIHKVETSTASSSDSSCSSQASDVDIFKVPMPSFNATVRTVYSNPLNNNSSYNSGTLITDTATNSKLKCHKRVAVIGNLYQIMQVLPTLWSKKYCVVPIETSFTWGFSEVVQRLALSKCHLVLGSCTEAEEYAENMGLEYDRIENYSDKMIRSEEDYTKALQDAIANFRFGQPMYHLYGPGCSKPCVLSKLQIQSRLKLAQEVWKFKNTDVVQCLESETLIDGAIAPVLAGAKLALPNDKQALSTVIFTTDLLCIPKESGESRAESDAYRKNYRIIALNMLERMSHGGLTKIDLQENIKGYKNVGTSSDNDGKSKKYGAIQSFKEYDKEENTRIKLMQGRLKRWYYKPETGTMGVGLKVHARKPMKMKFIHHNKSMLIRGRNVSSHYFGFEKDSLLRTQYAGRKARALTSYRLDLRSAPEHHNVGSKSALMGRKRHLTIKRMQATLRTIERIKNGEQTGPKITPAELQEKIKNVRIMQAQLREKRPHNQPSWHISQVAIVKWPEKKAAKGGYKYITKKHTNMKRIMYTSKYKK